MIDNELEKKIR